MMEDKLKEIITVDELQEYIENQQNKNFKALFEVQRTALLYFLHSYINEIEEDSLFHNILIIIGRALFVLNHISTGTTLIARQLELFKLMNQIQPQNDIFFETRLAPDVSQFNNINLMDMLGLIIRHHNDFKSCPFEIINTEIQHFASKEDFESFKQSHDMYTISHEQLKELIDKGWRFSIPELYQYFNAIFSPEFMQNVLLAQSLAGDNNTQFVSLLEMNETNKNKDISIYKYLKFNRDLYYLITNQSLKVKTTFFEIYTNNPNMDLKNDFCRLLISKFGLPIPQTVSIDFLNLAIICENTKYKEELLKKAKTDLSFDQRFEWFITKKITDEKLVNALFESDKAITIINAFKSAKLLKLSRKEALLGIKTISKNEVFNIQEINLS